MKKLRIFLSSPGDMRSAREIAAETIERLAQEFSRHFVIEPYLWEHEAMLASGHFQDSIEVPSAFDIVILLLWSRLGTPLPERTALRTYRGIDGRAPVTGTEWEYENALEAARQNGVPDLLVYRSLQAAPMDARDAEARSEQLRQLAALDEFWSRHFVNRGLFLGAYTDFSDNSDLVKSLESHLRKLIQKRLADAATAHEAPATWTRSPFRGLESYDYEHAPIFFGQDEAITQGMLQLAERAAAGIPFLMVLGASGAGKSSLVKAGLLPRLFVPRRVPGTAFLRRSIFRPSDALAQGGLIDGFWTLLAAPGRQRGLPELLSDNRRADDLEARRLANAVGAVRAVSVALAKLTEEARRAGLAGEGDNGVLALVIDQFEELYTDPRISVRERAAFLDLLVALATSGGVWLIATMRKDLWHLIDQTPVIARMSVGSSRLELMPPTSAQIGQMILQPARAAGLSFELHAKTGLPLNEIIADEVAGEPGALPLLSYLLDQLYQADVVIAKQAVLTYANYEKLGRLRGAIATQAQRVLDSCGVEEREALNSVLFSLMQFSSSDGEQRVVSRRIRIDAFRPGSPQRRLVDALLAPTARLLVSDSNAVGAPTVRLAHEALITHWELGRSFVRSQFDSLKSRRRIEDRYQLWFERMQAASTRASSGWRWFSREPGLLADVDLADGVNLLRDHADEAEPQIAQFINRSAAADRRIRNRAFRLMTAIVILVSALAAAATGAGVLAQRNAIEAERQRDQTVREQTRVLTNAAGQHIRDTLEQRIKDHDVRLAEGIIIDVLQRIDPADPSYTEAASVFEEAIAADALVEVLAGHRGSITSVCASSNGGLFATSSTDETARIWDASIGVELRALAGHAGAVRSVQFSPDGSRIVTASLDGTARVWEAATGRRLGVLAGHKGGVNYAAFSPDATRIVTASEDGDAIVWDAASFSQLAVLRGHAGPVLSARFSPDSRFVVTASHDRTARVWDAASGPARLVLSGHTEAVTFASFSPDGRLVVTSSMDKTSRVWDARTGGQTALLYGHLAGVESAVFSADGRIILTASDDKTARTWNAANGALIAVFSGHVDKVLSADFVAGANLIVTASADGTSRLWRLSPAEQRMALRGHSELATGAAFSHDGKRVVAGSADKTAIVWDAATGAPIATLTGHNGAVNSATFSPDDSLIATASYDGEVGIWDAKSYGELRTFDLHGWEATAASFSPDGKRIVTASEDRTARIWDVASGATLQSLTGLGDVVRSAVFSPDGARVLAASDDGTALVWDAASGQSLLVLRGHRDAVRSAAYAPDGDRIVTASNDKTARIWDAKTGKELLTLSGHTDVLRSATFSVDGKYVLTASYDRTARIWDAATGALLRVLPVAGDGARAAAYSPDGRTIATASLDSTVTLWSVDIDGAFDDQIAWAAAAETDPPNDEERDRIGLPARVWTSAPTAAPGALAAMADRAHALELDAAQSKDRDRRNRQLLEAFSLYAAATRAAEIARDPEAEEREWRYRRATLARQLARDHMLSEVARRFRQVVASDPSRLVSPGQ